MDEAIRSSVVPDEWEEQARGLIPAYILFEREYWTGEKIGFCSRCGHSFRGGQKRTESLNDPEVKFRYAVHNDRLRCPECGADAVMKARGKFRNMKTLRGNVRAVFCQKITPKHVRLRAFYIEWAFPDYNAVRPDLDFYEDFFMDLEPGSAEARRKVSGTADNWQTVGIREPWPSRDALNPYKDMDYTIFTEGLEGTFLGYLPITEMECWDWSHETSYGNWNAAIPWCKVLGWAARFPSLEMVAKLGGLELIFDLVFSGKKNVRYVDWNARRITDFLRIPREYAKTVAREHLDLDVIRIVKDLGVDADTAIRWCNNGWDGSSAKTAGAETVRYLEKQGYGNNGLSVLADYREAAAFLGRDMSVPTIRWPKRLRDAHDEATASADAIQEERRDEIRRKAKKGYIGGLYPELRRRFEYESGEYMAVVPERLEDITLEGKLMEHCVGGYADRHARGVLAILFIRRVACPMMPCWTVELTPEGNLTQIQGFHNRTENKPQGEAAAWVEEWLRVVKQRIRKERKNG